MNTITNTTIIDARWNKNGNIKIGSDIWSFSKLAGSGTVKGCKGSCRNCEGCYNPENPKKSPCYVFKSYQIYPHVVDSHIRNTKSFREDINKAFEQLNGQINRAKNTPPACRIFASGELETAEELLKWFALARKNPQTKFYMYTKMYNILDEVLPTTTIPNNMYINISIWHENGIECYKKWNRRKNIRAFVYVDDTYDYSSKLKINCMCPAYKKGVRGIDHNHPCSKCKLCFQDKAKVVGCYEH